MNVKNILMVGFLLTALLVSAASAADLVVTPQSSTSALGEVTEVTLRVENVAHLGGFDIDLHWDPSVVTLDTEPDNVTIGSLFCGHVNNSAWGSDRGGVRVAALNASLDGVSGAAELFTVRLKTVDDTGKSTPVAVVVNNYGFLNSTSGDDIPVNTITNATITAQRVNRIVSYVGVTAESVPLDAETVSVFTVANQRNVLTSKLTINSTIYAPNGSVFNTEERSGVILKPYEQNVQQIAWTPTQTGTYVLNVTVTSDTDLPVVGTTTAERSVAARNFSLEFHPYVYGYSRPQVDTWFWMVWYVKPSESGKVKLNLSVPESIEVWGEAESELWMTGDALNYVAFRLRATEIGTFTRDQFNLTASAHGKTASKTSTHDVSVWVPSMEVSSVDSVKVDTTGDFEMSYNTLHTNNTCDNQTTIIVQSGARGRTLAGLGYLVGYPYGCVEQTTSRMLASMNVKNYYLDRSDRPANFQIIRNDANTSVSNGVVKLVRGGQVGQHEDGGWSLWGCGESESSSSSYAAYTLARVNESGEDLNHLLNGKVSSDATVDDGTVNFEKAVEWFHENPDDDSSGTWTWSAGVCHAWTPTSNTGFVMLIHDMIRDQGTVAEPYATYMTENMQNATRYFVGIQNSDEGYFGNGRDRAMATALGLWGLEVYGTPSDDVTQDQINDSKAKATEWLIKNHDADGCWGADPVYGYSSKGRRSESTAYAILALNATGIPAENETIQGGVNWLVEQYESGGKWGYTWATQAAIDALIHCQPIEVSDGTLSISIDGEDICTLEVNETNPKVEYPLTADQMATVMANGKSKREITQYSKVKQHAVTVTRNNGNGMILVSIENTQRAPVNEIDDPIEDTGTILSTGGIIPDNGSPDVVQFSEDMDILGDAAPGDLFDTVTLTSDPSPLVANESGKVAIQVVSGVQGVFSPMIEVPIEGFTFANGTISDENGNDVAYQVLHGSVNTDSTSIFIQANEWTSDETYTYVFDAKPTHVGTLNFNLRFKALNDEDNVTLVEKSLDVIGRGDVAVKVTDENDSPVVATIVLDGSSQTASSHTFEGLLVGNYSLSVSKENYITVNTTVSVEANDETNVTVMMPTDLTTPRLIFSQGSGMLAGVSKVPGTLSAAFAENVTYNATVVGNGGRIVLALEFPQRFLLNNPVVRLNGVVLDPSQYEIRSGTFSNPDPYEPFSTTNATIIIYDAPDGVSEISIEFIGGRAGQALVGDHETGILDALRLAQFDVGLKGAPETFGYGDVSGDLMVNILDALRIAQYDAGLIPDLA
ncbi:PEGA domain-containing protein [Methanofollis aquaemaris]|uniref:PEGA domain-containing protein n=1 Tax=Methanofollis aquaemaris TaxID=126734 RepID=A0A8A3S657_9EURY|nr:PEGA domain-containing protein [Methanofollis aquaemaris]QSZ67615.1 PEGA domain-containing protein [Methanofollis aquaemaris]